MRFSRLRLLGFKSFVEPGEFVIERGLTGIVGPNGCGKSNLVEALRWVMGESSYKNMRASGMDDVIFSGSGTRPASNTAEVTLFLDNTDRTAPAAFNDADELQVSRRIEREAGSVYRINGKEARAKDVQLLFADQSTGARSPSMVGQGRIGELIQAKPQARRALLEEAAGISGLHTRRHEAELRLRAAEQNLERLDDVVGELEGQIEKPEAPGPPGFALQEPFRRYPQGRGDAAACALDAGQGAGGGSAVRAFRRRPHWSANAPAPRWKPPRNRRSAPIACPNCARPKPRQPRPISGCPSRKAQIEEEAARVERRRVELARRLEQLDADIVREEQMVRDNADVLQRLDDGRSRAERRECLVAGARDIDTWSIRSRFGCSDVERSSTCEADGRTGRGGRRTQPDRARAARDDRATRPARAAACECRPRGGRNRRADRRACRSGGEEVPRRAGAGSGWKPPRRLPTLLRRRWPRRAWPKVRRGRPCRKRAANSRASRPRRARSPRF